MRARRWRMVGALAAALLAAQTAAQAAIVLSPAQQRRIGVAVEVLTPQRSSAKVNAFAKVLDTGPLAQLESDLEAAEAAAAASGPEAERARRLYQSNNGVAAKDYEAAESQARQDRSKLALLRLRLGLEWGPGVAKLPEARRRSLIAALSRGQAALVQLDTPSNEGQADARSAEIDIGDSTVTAAIIGHSRTAEPRLTSSGLIAIVTGKSAVLFSNGLTQSARLISPGQQTGVVLPRAAILRYQGSDWAYVRSGDSFERRMVASPSPQGDGYFVAQGFSPGEAVAVKGVAALFAAERAGPASPVGKPGR